MCSETSEAVGTTWEHAKLEFQKFLKIRITLMITMMMTDSHYAASGRAHRRCKEGPRSDFSATKSSTWSCSSYTPCPRAEPTTETHIFFTFIMTEMLTLIIYISITNSFIKFNNIGGKKSMKVDDRCFHVCTTLVRESSSLKLLKD